MPADPKPAEEALVLTNGAFVGYAARLSQKAAGWSADTAMCFFMDAPGEAMKREPAMRFIAEMRAVLDHMEKQVQP